MSLMTNTPLEQLPVLLDRQRRAFEREAVVSVEKRIDRINRVISLLVDNQVGLCEATSVDFGHRSLHQARMADIFGSINSLQYAKKNVHRWMKPQKRHVDPPLNILGATSGDTGSAAEYAMRGKKGVAVFMTSPHGRMSAFQQAQMFSLMDANIHNIAVQGVFDDCQDIVKAVSGDLAFKRKYRIGTVNSINWARLVAQVVYYFAGYFQATTSNDQKVRFTVPSGNFGNVCAGHVARMMGLPIDRLVVATNENDVLDEFFRTGVYRVRSSADTHETSSPSMDISKASNFERFVFDLVGRDAALVRDLFDRQLREQGAFDLSGHPAFGDCAKVFGFASGRSTHADRLATIRDTDARFGQVIDTHTADGLKVARAHLSGDLPMIVLETALPIKFADTIVEALGRQPARPAGFDGIEALPKRVLVLPPDVATIKALIAANSDARD